MNKILVERLKKLRTEDSELSQAKFANILGVGQTTVAAWEVGRSEPDSEMLIRLANFFKVSVDYLIGKSNNMYSPEDEIEIRGASRARNIASRPQEKGTESNNQVKQTDQPYIPQQPTMRYIHVPMRGGKDKEVFVTDEKYKEIEKNLREAGQKHYQDEKNNKK